MFAFGLVTLLQGLVTSYSGLLTTRFFLGVFEAGMFPGAFYLLSSWYRRDEAQRRVSFPFFFPVSFYLATGSLLQRAVGVEWAGAGPQVGLACSSAFHSPAPLRSQNTDIWSPILTSLIVQFLLQFYHISRSVWWFVSGRYRQDGKYRPETTWNHRQRSRLEVHLHPRGCPYRPRQLLLFLPVA